MIDLFPGKSVSRSCFSKLQLCVPCSRGSVKYCHGGCLRPQAEPRVPPAPTRRSTILDLVSQSGDHHLLFMLLKQVLRSVNNIINADFTCCMRSPYPYPYPQLLQIPPPSTTVSFELIYYVTNIHCHYYLRDYHGNLSSSFFWV